MSSSAPEPLPGQAPSEPWEHPAPRPDTSGRATSAAVSTGIPSTAYQGVATGADNAVRLPYHRAAHVDSRTCRWWRPLATIAALIGLGLVLSIALIVVLLICNAIFPSLQPTSENLEDGSNPVDLLLALGPLALLIPLAIYATRLGGGRWGMHSVTGRFRWRFMLGAAPVVVTFFALAIPGLSLLFSFDEFHVKHSAGRIALALLVVVLITPLQSAGEEYLFRGLAQQAFGTWLKRPWVGVLLPIPLFCIGHGYDWVGQIDIAVFALCAGLLVWKSGGLELAILMHAANNVMSMLLGPFSDDSASLAQGEVDPLSLVFSLPLPILTTLYLWWYTNRRYGVSWSEPVTASVGEARPVILPKTLQELSEPFTPTPAWGALPQHTSAQPFAGAQPGAGATPLGPTILGTMPIGGHMQHTALHDHYAPLHDVADRAAIYATFRQQLAGEAITDAVGVERNFEVDGRAGRLSFVGAQSNPGEVSVTQPPKRLDVRGELVATVDPQTRVLRWGWADPRGGGQAAAAVRRLGERFRLPNLSAPEVPFAPERDSSRQSEEASDLAHLAGRIATEAVRDEGFYYSVPTDAGTREVYWVTGLQIRDIDMPYVSEHLPRTGAQINSFDLRSGLLGLAEHLGWFITWADASGTSARLSDPSGQHLTVTFNAGGDITDVTANVTKNQT